jgi:hypothetical protein
LRSTNRQRARWVVDAFVTVTFRLSAIAKGRLRMALQELPEAGPAGVVGLAVQVQGLVVAGGQAEEGGRRLWVSLNWPHQAVTNRRASSASMSESSYRLSKNPGMPATSRRPPITRDHASNPPSRGGASRAPGSQPGPGEHQHRVHELRAVRADPLEEVGMAERDQAGLHAEPRPLDLCIECDPHGPPSKVGVELDVVARREP